MLKSCRLALCASLLALAAPVAAPAQPAEEQAAQVEAFKRSFQPRYGTVVLPDAKAKLELGQSYYFLGPADARKVLVDAWGNPPDVADGVLGLVFPVGADFSDSWGAVVTYEESGHVSDSDAASQDYEAVLKNMQEATEAANEERVAAGYARMHLVGWAQAPTYDPARKVLVWARNLKSEDSSENGLNYDVRSLGRTGVLSLNMVDGMSNLGTVDAAAGELGATVQFDEGARYADYNPATDASADYGLAGLVAAGAGLGAAKKIGLLGIIAAFGKKFIALIAAVVLGLGGWLKRRFGGGYRADDEGEA
jgi:uncharacterized membrane-anchored protein